MPSITSRITSKDILIQFRASGAADATHVEHLYFHADVSGGTFKIRVNGEVTSAITFSATPATLVSNINTALDALPNLTAGDIVATGTVITDITLTGAADGFYRILLEDLGSLTGNSSGAANATQETTTVGGTLITLSAEASSFSWEESVGTVDVTAISEYARTEIDVDSSATFDISLFEANSDWAYQIFAGQSGYFYVYQEGKVAGKKYLVLQGLIESFSQDFPDHEKVEISISGMRQGEWVVPPNSVYR